MKVNSTKQHIVETASRLFYHNSYNLTGINEIIKEAGIAKATLYNHFKSKDDICIAFLKYKNEGFIDDLRSFVTKKPTGRKQVLALFDYIMEFFKSDEFNGCWCINIISEIPKEKEIIRTEIRQQKEGLRQFIQELLKSNYPDLKAKEIKLLGNQVYVLYEGALSEAYLHNEIWPVQAGKVTCDKIID